MDNSSEFQIFNKKDYTKEYYKNNKEKIKSTTKRTYERNKMKQEQQRLDSEAVNKFLGVK